MNARQLPDAQILVDLDSAPCHGYDAGRAALLSDIDDWHGRTKSSALTSMQPFHGAQVQVTYELDEDGSVIPLTVAINGEEVDSGHFGVAAELAWSKGIEAELKGDAVLRLEDAAQDAVASLCAWADAWGQP